MKKIAKKTIKHAPKRAKAKRSRSVTRVYGIEREFVIITGGGFLVVVMAMLLFFN